MAEKNDVEITITKQVEEREVYTINTITRDMIDLESRKKLLLSEIEEIEIKTEELKDVKEEVLAKLQ